MDSLTLQRAANAESIAERLPTDATTVVVWELSRLVLELSRAVVELELRLAATDRTLASRTEHLV